MSEQMPQDQVGPTPVEPSTPTTEQGYTLENPVGRVEDKDMAHVMAVESKTDEETALRTRKEAEEAINAADSEIDPFKAKIKLGFANEKMSDSEAASQAADFHALEAAKKYVANEAEARALLDRVDAAKKQT
jgi:hypothetical protein